MTATQRVLRQIALEREYQDRRWGTEFDDTHTPADWWTIASLYLSRALPSWKIKKDNPLAFDAATLRAGLVKLAAIIVAWIEALDRKETTDGVQES